MSKRKYRSTRFFVKKRLSQIYHNTDTLLSQLHDAVEAIRPAHPELAEQLEQIAVGYAMLQQAVVDFTEKSMGEDPEGLNRWYLL